MTDLSKDEELGGAFAQQANSAPSSSPTNNLANDPEFAETFGAPASQSAPPNMTLLQRTENLFNPSNYIPAMKQAYSQGILGSQNADPWANMQNSQQVQNTLQKSFNIAAPAMVGSAPMMSMGTNMLTSLLPKTVMNSLSSMSQPAANYLNRVVTGTGITSGAQYVNPNNQQSLGDIAENNLIMNAGFGAIPSAMNAIGKGASYFRPQAQSENILQNLGQGAQTQEDNAQAFAGDVRDAYAGRMAEYQSQINPVLQKYGSQSIYPMQNPYGVNLDNPAQLTVPKDLLSGEGAKAIAAFNANPTLQNAHDLQSMIGTEIGSTMRQPPSMEKGAALSNLNEWRGNIKNGASSFLNDVDPAAADQYSNASDYFRDNVVPYRSDTKLRAIAEGKDTNPENLHTIFSSPNMEENPDASMMNAPIQKVMQDLPDSANGRILFSKLGNNTLNPDPEKLNNALLSAQNKGYSSYFTPEIQDQVNALPKSITARNALQHGVGTVGGLLAASHIGSEFPGKELISGGAGYAGGRLMSAIPLPGADNTFTNAIGNMYQPTVNALIANRNQ